MATVAKNVNPAWRIFGAGVMRTFSVDHISNNGGVFTGLNSDGEPVFEYDENTELLNIVSDDYPELTETDIDLSIESSYSSTSFDWTPGSTPPDIPDGETVAAGNTYYQVATHSQVAKGATYIQLDAVAASGVTLTLYGRVHPDASWAQVGQWVEGVDTFPVQVFFEEPLNEVYVVGDSDTDWSAWAQRSAAK